MSRPLEPWLRQLLRCPACRGPLTDRVDETGAAFLDCAGACAAGAPPGDMGLGDGTGCPGAGQDRPGASGGRSYRIEDGIPVLLIEEAAPSTNQARSSSWR